MPPPLELPEEQQTPPMEQEQQKQSLSIISSSIGEAATSTATADVAVQEIYLTSNEMVQSVTSARWGWSGRTLTITAMDAAGGGPPVDDGSEAMVGVIDEEAEAANRRLVDGEKDFANMSQAEKEKTYFAMIADEQKQKRNAGGATKRKKSKKR